MENVSESLTGRIGILDLYRFSERDVRQLINIKDENKFVKFISSVAARTAQEYNAFDIANVFK